MAAKCADSSLCSSHGAFATIRQLLFPCERVGDDRIEILESRAPRQCRVNSFDICYERRRITRPAGGDFDGKVVTARAAHGGNHLQN